MTNRAISSARKYPARPVVLLVPAATVLAVLTIVPTVGVIALSWVHWTPFSAPSWAGTSNFEALARDSSFWNSLRVTVVFVFSATTLEILLGILIAWLMEGWPRWRGPLRLVFALPLVMSPAIVGIVWRLALNEQGGVFWRLLSSVLGQSARPLSTTTGAIATIVAVDVWQWTPLVILLLSMALEGHRTRLDDAVKVDRLSDRAALRHIWGPLVLPTLGIAAILRTIDTLKVFDIVQTTTAGGPGGASEVLSLYCYKQLVKFGDFGYAAALACCLLVMATSIWLGGMGLVYGSWRSRGGTSL